MKTAYHIGYADCDEMIDNLISELEKAKGGKPFYYCIGPDTKENRQSSVDAMMKYNKEKSD